MNEAIVACARGWIGTRFHHQGRLKKTAAHRGGVDCLGLLVGIARELQLKTPGGIALASLDETDYSHMPDTGRLADKLGRVLSEIPPGQIAAGDIVLLDIDGNPQHLGIVTHLKDRPGLLHAYAPARAVVEHLLDNQWRQRIVKAFRFSF